MSSFASRHQKTIDNPFESGVTFTIQKLNGAAVEQAQAKHMASFVVGRNPRGWAGIFHEKLQQGTATNEDALKLIRDPLAGYDRLTVAKLGLVAWSYVDEASKEPLPITSRTVEDLDDETLEHVATEILRLTKPRLFETVKEAETARKNG
jgi:hypothetical protein